jgi:hypothetical protein
MWPITYSLRPRRIVDGTRVYWVTVDGVCEWPALYDRFLCTDKEEAQRKLEELKKKYPNKKIDILHKLAFKSTDGKVIGYYY